MVQVTNAILVAAVAGSSIVAAQPHSKFHAKKDEVEKRSCGDWVTANINGQDVTFQDNWDCPGGVLPGQKRDAVEKRACGDWVTANINGQDVTFQDNWDCPGGVLPGQAAPAPEAPVTNSQMATNGLPKKGLAYNDVALITPEWTAGSSRVGWAYNWASNAPNLPSNIKFIPTLHDRNSVGWFNTDSKNFAPDVPIFSFNEPDMDASVGGSGIDPRTAAVLHHDNLNRFGGHPVGAPSVSSDENNPNRSFSWLTKFANECRSLGGGCKVDFCNVHWYGWNADGGAQAREFNNFVGRARDKCQALFGTNKLFVTEFAAEPQSDTRVQQDFMRAALPFLDGADYVEGYSYFMVDRFMGTRGGPNDLGRTYLATN